MTVQPREFCLSDLGEVLRIEAASFPEDAYSEGTFRGWHEMSPGLFLVAAAKGPELGLTGYVIGAVERAKERGVAQARGRIVSIAIDPIFRRRGDARALSDGLIGRLEGVGVAVIDLETRVDNRAAIGLWEGLGFRATGVIPGYYGGRVDALTMRKTVVEAYASV